MKRFGFFLAVFSIGLVVFLVSTGQLSTLLTGGPGDSAKIDAPAGADSNATTVTVHWADTKTGRLIFSFRGEIDDLTGVLDIRDLREHEWTMKKAVMEVPIAATQKRPAHDFEISAEDVSYYPRPPRIVMRGVRGIGDDGTRLDTAAVEVTWEDDTGEVLLVGDRPVDLQYPAFRLHGESGFRAEIRPNVGLSDLVVLPPLRVAIDKSRGTDLVGVDPEKEDPKRNERPRIILDSAGSLVVERHLDEPGTARFESKVVVFESPNAELIPAPPHPETRFECAGMELVLDPKTEALVRASATGTRETPIIAYLEGGFRALGDRLDWVAGETPETGEATLAGNLSVVGPLGNLSADLARYSPATGRLHLDGNVLGLLSAEELRLESARRAAAKAEKAGREPKADDPEKKRWIDERLLHDLDLSADSAVFRLADDPDASSRLVSFRATSKSADGVTIKERAPGTARLHGSALEYIPEDGTLRVLGDASHPTLRPILIEANNQITADLIELRRDERDLTFSGGVHAKIFEIPLDEGKKLPDWFVETSGDGPTTINCERLHFAWDEASEIAEIEAVGGAEPISFRGIGEETEEETYSLTGNRIVWKDGVAELSGEPGGQILRAMGTEVAAGLIRYHFEERRAEAEDGVTVRTNRGRWLDDLDPSEDREVVITGPRLTVQLHQPPAKDEESSSDGETASTDKAPKKDPEKPEPLEFVRAWSEDGELIEGDDGELSFACHTLFWGAAEGKLVLEGDGRQTLRYHDPDAPDGNEVSARTMTLWRRTQRVILTGEVAATVNQKSLAKRLRRQADAEEKDDEEPGLTWNLTAGSMELGLAKVPDSQGRERLVMAELIAGESVTLTNPEKQLSFEGTACEYRREGQLLRLFAPPGRTQKQALSRGRGPLRDELFAGVIRIVRVGSGDHGHLNVLFEDGVDAKFHSRGGPAPASDGDRELPDEFTLRSESLLLVLDDAPESAASTVAADTSAIREALAWGGDVIFRSAPDYRVIAQRAAYRRGASGGATLTFYGDEKNRVQLTSPGLSKPAQRVVLREKPDGGYGIEIDRGDPWSGGELEETLKLFERKETKD